MVNKAGLDLIKDAEGVRFRVYADPVGLPTVGVGHLVRSEDQLQLDDVISMDQVDAFLQKDLRIAEDAVWRNVKVELNENQVAACVSLCFNIGERNFQKSNLLRYLNAGNYQAAADSFRSWSKARKKGKLVELPGLVKRRAAEKALFLKEPDTAPPSPVATPTAPQ